MHSKLNFLLLLLIAPIFLISCDDDDDKDKDDDICPELAYYYDGDQDGFGSPDSVIVSCDQPAGFVSNNLDINDSKASLNPNTVWQGAKLTFTKANNADWTLDGNHDKITDKVWLTRGNNGILFNYKASPDGDGNGCGSSEPADTEWAFGTISGGVDTLSYGTFISSSYADCGPPSIVGKDAVVHLISEDIYIGIKFTSWSSGGSGGGIVYERTTKN